MFAGKKSHFPAFFLLCYFLIIFLDDFIVEGGAGQRRRPAGGRDGGRDVVGPTQPQNHRGATSLSQQGTDTEPGHQDHVAKPVLPPHWISVGELGTPITCFHVGVPAWTLLEKWH